MLRHPSHINDDVRLACIAALAVRQELPGDGSLSNAIYSAIYAGGWRGEGGWSQFDVQKHSVFNESFLRQMHEAANPIERSDGWTVVSEDTDTVTLTRDGILAVSPRSSVVVTGETASIKVSALKLGSPGFIYRKHNEQSEPLTCRIYLSIKPEQASWVLGLVASVLISSSVPFEMKVLSNPLAYWRLDAAVIYTSMAKKDTVLQRLDEAQKQLATPLRANRLLLTQRNGRGIGVAEQPSDGRSHGQWVTELLISATDQASDLDEVTDCFWNLVDRDGRARSSPSYYR